MWTPGETFGRIIRWPTGVLPGGIAGNNAGANKELFSYHRGDVNVVMGDNIPCMADRIGMARGQQAMRLAHFGFPFHEICHDRLSADRQRQEWRRGFLATEIKPTELKHQREG